MELETDPGNYNEAIQDKDATLWEKAMNTEMESMYSNQVWTLVDQAVGVKPIGCKYIYKRKRGIDGRLKPSRHGLWQMVTPKKKASITKRPRQ